MPSSATDHTVNYLQAVSLLSSSNAWGHWNGVACWDPSGALLTLLLHTCGLRRHRFWGHQMSKYTKNNTHTSLLWQHSDYLEGWQPPEATHTHRLHVSPLAAPVGFDAIPETMDHSLQPLPCEFWPYARLFLDVPDAVSVELNTPDSSTSLLLQEAFPTPQTPVPDTQWTWAPEGLPRSALFNVLLAQFCWNYTESECQSWSKMQSRTTCIHKYHIIHPALMTTRSLGIEKAPKRKIQGAGEWERFSPCFRWTKAVCFN